MLCLGIIAVIPYAMLIEKMRRMGSSYNFLRSHDIFSYNGGVRVTTNSPSIWAQDLYLLCQFFVILTLLSCSFSLTKFTFMHVNHGSSAVYVVQIVVLVQFLLTWSYHN